MANLVGLYPEDMGTLGDLQPIQFSVNGGDAVSFYAVWIRYEGDDNEILAYDGTNLRYPFDKNSIVTKPKGDDSLVNFKIIPELGWQGNLPEVRVQGYPAVS